jgi:hypothetical protein
MNVTLVTSILGTSDILYHFDQVFTILGNFHAEMAEKFSFDLRRLKKILFFRCDA